jgi:ribosomal protein S12 methylthiotransferase
VLIDEPGVGRSHREAPEIDGIVQVPESLVVGSFARVRIVDAMGPDLIAEPVTGELPVRDPLVRAEA